MRIALTFACVLASGCNSVDLSAVHDFAEETTAAKTPFEAISEDWLGTCVRRTEYARQTPSQLRLVPADENVAVSNPGPNCADAATFALQWKARNDLVIAYVRALGALAGIGSVPKNTAMLAGGISDLGVLPAADKGAFADIAGKIASASIEGQQRRAIGGFARDNDVALHTALKDLHFIADRYDEELVDEASALDQMFRDTLRAQTVDGTPSAPEPPAFQARRLELEAVREQWEKRRSDLRKRHEKTAAYRDALDTIGEAHADIVARADHFGPADLALDLKAYADSFGDDVATLAQPLEK